MRTPSGTFATKLAASVATIARVWQVTRADGVVLRLTDHDQDITIGADTYRADIGFTASSVLSAIGADIQGVTMTLAAQDDLISAEDIFANVYDKAQCVLRLVDWADPNAGSMFLFGGEVRWSEIDDEKRLVMEIAGLLSRNRYIDVESYSSTCRADLGDARCTFDIEAEKETFTVAAVTARNKFTTVELNQADEHWTLGVLRFTSGNNNGVATEVRKSKQSTKGIELFLATPFVLEPGDTGEIWPGCDKSPTMCQDRYSNIINFRGEAFLADQTTTDLRRYEK